MEINRYIRYEYTITGKFGSVEGAREREQRVLRGIREKKRRNSDRERDSSNNPRFALTNYNLRSRHLRTYTYIYACVFIYVCMNEPILYALKYVLLFFRRE